MRQPTRTLALALALGLFASACDDDGGEVKPDATTDITADATPDAEDDTGEDVTEPDAEPDVTPDAEPDVDEDVTPDVGPDVDEDVEPDVTPDVIEDVDEDALTDVDEDVDQDVAPDVEPDTNGAEPLVLDGDLVTAACEGLCGDILDSCGQDWPGVGGSLEGCLAGCIANATEDGWWLASYTCATDVCDAELCFQDQPFAPAPACDAGCAGLDACDLLGVIDLPEDQPDLCRAACTGFLAGSPAAEGVISCLADATADGCNEAEVQACASGGSLCEALCGQVFGEPGNDLYCAPGSAVFDTWADQDACLSACQPFEDADAGLVFAGCLLTNDCGDPTVCAELTPEIAPACQETCDGLAALCEGDLGGDLTADNCPGFCTGAVGQTGLGAATGAEACVATITECPETGEDVFGVLLQCAFATPPECEALCTDLAACGIVGGEGGPTPVECATFCKVDSINEGELEPLMMCVAAADGDCGVIVDQCLPEEAGDAICGAACSSLLACGEVASIEECEGECQGTLDLGAPAVMVASCAALSECEAINACQALAEAEVAPECVTACTGAEVCIDDGTSLCEAACTGALSALASSGEAAAACVVSALGEGCALSDTTVCAD